MTITEKEKQGLRNSVCLDCTDPGPSVWEKGDCPFAQECHDVLITLYGIADRTPGFRPGLRPNKN